MQKTSHAINHKRNNISKKEYNIMKQRLILISDKSGQRFARIFFARRGEGRRKAVALQGRQRSIAENRPQRLSIFYLSLVLYIQIAQVIQIAQIDVIAAIQRTRTKPLVPVGRFRHGRAGEERGDDMAVDDRPHTGENEHELDDFFKHMYHS